MIAVSKIYRYPIKGLSAQPLSAVSLEADKPLPQDRIFALARPGAPIDRDEPKWAKKGLFVMLMLDEGLARVNTELDLDSLRLNIKQGNREVAAGRLTDETDRERLEQFFWQLLPALPSPPILVRSAGGHFMDKPDNVISLINLATVRSLEEKWGVEIDPLRFRANIYIDGAKPWEEFDWVGSDITIGNVVFAADRKNGRCGATNVNPVSGRRDLDIPGSLRATFGHKNLGIYLTVRDGGELAIGDTLLPPRATGIRSAAVDPPPPANGAQRRFICRGCYYIYEEAAGLPQQWIKPGTPFAAIPGYLALPGLRNRQDDIPAVCGNRSRALMAALSRDADDAVTVGRRHGIGLAGQEEQAEDADSSIERRAGPYAEWGNAVHRFVLPAVSRFTTPDFAWCSGGRFKNRESCYQSFQRVKSLVV